MSSSYRNQSTDLQRKLIELFLYVCFLYFDLELEEFEFEEFEEFWNLRGTLVFDGLQFLLPNNSSYVIADEMFECV